MTYTIIGGDKKEYGMVSADDMRRWITEGRLNAQTLVKAESDAEFRQLGEFPEFAAMLAAEIRERSTTPAAAIQPPIGGSRDAALGLVKGPAMALIVTAGLGIAYYAFSGIFTLITGGAMFQQQMPANIPPEWEPFIKGMQGPLAGFINLAVAALNGFVLFGAIKMLRLQNRGLAVAVSIVAMLPCQCCCVFGLPFGIWALVVLNKPEVKSQFG